MSRWTVIFTSLIVLIFGACSAMAGDAPPASSADAAKDVPRNIELKPGAKTAEDAPPRQDAPDRHRRQRRGRARTRQDRRSCRRGTSSRCGRRRGAASRASRRQARAKLRYAAPPPGAPLDRRPALAQATSSSRCRPSSDASAAIPVRSTASGAAARARRLPRSVISPRSTSPIFRPHRRSSASSRARRPWFAASRPKAVRHHRRLIMPGRPQNRLHPRSITKVTEAMAEAVAMEAEVMAAAAAAGY